MSLMPPTGSATVRAAEDTLMCSTSSTSAVVTPLICCAPSAGDAGPACIRAGFSGPLTWRIAMFPFSILEIA